jgi:hypothetical protein
VRRNAAKIEAQSLQDQSDTMLSEARMVLPGIQALFGFQLIAVFSDRFAELPERLQYLHLGATVLVTVAVALIMAPAAYQRISERKFVSAAFIRLGSILISLAMGPLALAIAAGVYLLAAMTIAPKSVPS